MEPFSAAVITSLTNDLAKQVVGNLKGTLKTKLVGAPAEQALRRSLGAGIVALIAQATAAQPEEEVLLHDIFTEFFQYKAVRTQIDGLLNGQPLDHGRLKTLFDAAGFDADKLPHLDLDAGLDAFAAAFLAAAVGEPELQGALQIGKLQQSLGVQQALLLEMKGLADVLREQTAVAVRAGQVLAEGLAQPVYQWQVGKYVGRDEITDAANVLSGDFRGATLHIVNQYLSAPGERLWKENDFRDALNTYLTVIEDTYAKPELRGNIEVKDRMPDITLEKMYYSLAVLDKPEAREELFEEQVGKSERTPGQEPKQPVNMATLLRSRRRLVITGKPGSGKSTYLYLTASAVARALLGKGTELVDEHVGLPYPLPLPIFISLGEFNEYRKEPPDPGDPRHGTLLAYASSKAIKKYEAFVPKDFFERLIVGNQMCLFLLDGLDEIADETERQHVSEEIRSLSRNPKIGPVIVACRSWAYVGDTRLHAPFEEYEVQSMSAEQVDELVALWCGAAFSRLQAPKASADLSREIRQLEEKRRRRGDIRLADTPLMVTIIAIVFYNDEHLPDQRASLYKRCIRVLLIEKYKPTGKGKTARITKGGTEEDKLELLSLLAYNMMAAGEKAGRLVEEKDVRSWLLPLIAARQREGRPEEHLQSFLRAMVDHAGLLDERPRTTTRGRSYEFVHLSFQEYLCAGHIAGNPPGRVAASLLDGDFLTQTWWRETILLMPGYLAAVENRSAALALVSELSDVPRRDATALAAAELAGSAYLELNFNDRPTYEAVAARLKDLLRDEELSAPNPLRGLAGRALGRLGDPRPGVGVIVRDGLRLPDIAWGETVPAGVYTVGGDKDGGQPQSRQVTIDRPYQLARYPVTYAQFDCFIHAPDFADERWWAGMPAEEEAYGTTYRLRELSEQAFAFANHPRESVSWYQAVAFSRWLSDKLGEAIDLPREIEWEVAARYPDGRFYPWGNTFDPAKANTREGDSIGQTSAVGIFPQGANSALGLYDLSGNVWEWCRNKYEERDDDAIDGSGDRRVVRGGAWYFVLVLARAVVRLRSLPHARINDLGCRLVRRPPSHTL